MSERFPRTEKEREFFESSADVQTLRDGSSSYLIFKDRLSSDAAWESVIAVRKKLTGETLISVSYRAPNGENCIHLFFVKDPSKGALSLLPPLPAGKSETLLRDEDSNVIAALIAKCTSGTWTGPGYAGNCVTGRIEGGKRMDDFFDFYGPPDGVFGHVLGIPTEVGGQRVFVVIVGEYVSIRVGDWE